MTEHQLIDETILNEAKSMMKAKFSTMLQYFIEDSDMYVTSIREGIEAKNVGRLVAPAHTIKSSSKQLGAMRLSVIAQDIEYLARNSVSDTDGTDTAPFVPMLTDLEQALAETKIALLSASA